MKYQAGVFGQDKGKVDFQNIEAMESLKSTVLRKRGTPLKLFIDRRKKGDASTRSPKNYGKGAFFKICRKD